MATRGGVATAPATATRARRDARIADAGARRRATTAGRRRALERDARATRGARVTARASRKNRKSYDDEDDDGDALASYEASYDEDEDENGMTGAVASARRAHANATARQGWARDGLEIVEGPRGEGDDAAKRRRGRVRRDGRWEWVCERGERWAARVATRGGRERERAAKRWVVVVVVRRARASVAVGRRRELDERGVGRER